MARPEFVHASTLVHQTYDQAGSSALTIPWPSSYSEGDVGFCFLYHKSTTTTFEYSSVSGWNSFIEYTSSGVDSGSTLCYPYAVQVAYKRAESTAEPDVVWPFSTSIADSGRVSGCMLVFTGVRTTNESEGPPYEGVKIHTQEASTTGGWTALGSSVAEGSSRTGVLVNCLGSYFNTVSIPSNYAEIADYRNFTSSHGSAFSAQLYSLEVSTGNTSTDTFTPGGAFDTNSGGGENVWSLGFLLPPPEPGTAHEAEGSSVIELDVEADGSITRGIGVASTLPELDISLSTPEPVLGVGVSGDVEADAEIIGDITLGYEVEGSLGFDVEITGNVSQDLSGSIELDVSITGDIKRTVGPSASPSFTIEAVASLSGPQFAEGSLEAAAPTMTGSPTVELSFFAAESISMATNRLNLYNVACRSMGERPLASLNVNEEARFLLDEVYSSGKGVIKYALEQAYWDWAKRAQRVEADPSLTPLFGYQYAYPLPDDWVRLFRLATDEFFNNPINEYDINNGVLYAEVEELYWIYISCDTDWGADYSKWPETFTLWVGTWMASQVAPRLKAMGDLEKLMQKEEDYRLNAITKDAVEGPTRFPPDGSWAQARHAGTGSGRKDRGKRNTLIG